MKRTAARALIVLAMVFSLVSGCNCRGVDPDKTGYDRVVILFSAGYNSLRNYLYEDIQDLKNGYAPNLRSKDVFLVVSHLAVARGDYSTKTDPVLIRVFSDKKGVVFDTLKTWKGNLLMRSGEMNTVLSDIKRQFKSDHYGMVYSSHASGWMPAGYYNNPSYFEHDSGSAWMSARRALPREAVPYVEPEYIPGAHEVKSIGTCNQVEEGSGSNISYEMDLKDFASALPMHFDYILMDACLNGGIEVAYELKDKCDMLGFSPTEILAEGFDYEKIAGHLLGTSVSDPEAVLEDYFRQYAEEDTYDLRSATISYVDCSKLDALAAVCKDLFAGYRTQIASLDPYTVQRYYRTHHHWFYDLEDILVKAGISDAEHSRLTAALNGCIRYKAATDAFLLGDGGFHIRTYSGLSMYLPCNGSAFLDSFYKDLEWNKATLLVD